MRTPVIAVILATVIPTLVRSAERQSSAQKRPGWTANLTGQPRLSATVVGERYCLGTDDINTLRLKFRWTIQNGTQRRYVVRPRSVMITHFAIAPTADALEAGKDVIEADETTIEDSPTEPLEDYHRIDAGDSFELDALSELSIETVRSGHAAPATVGPGRYVLRAVVRARIAEIRQAADWPWRPGRLVPPMFLTSDPIGFTVSAEPALVKCNARDALAIFSPGDAVVGIASVVPCRHTLGPN
jgi:hypothetical protein